MALRDCTYFYALWYLLQTCNNMKGVSFLSIAGILTLSVRGLSYLGLTRSISWLLMPWLLTSPGHQQPWYWFCRIGRSLSYSRRNFNYPCVLLVWRNDIKCNYMFMFSLKNLARKGLTRHGLVTPNGVIKHGQHSSSVTIHYLDQYWFVANQIGRKKRKLHFNKN